MQLRLKAIQVFCSITVAAVLSAGPPASSQQSPDFRPPATPLVTHSPYFSVWEMNDTTTGDWSKHWTGRVQAICGQARIDGKAYRTMGMQPDTAPALSQT